MGIRINKVLGYGLVDIKTTGKYNEQLDDPRINMKGYFGNDCYGKDDNFTDDGFDAYIEAHKEHPDDINSGLGLLGHMRYQENIQKGGRPLRAGISHRIIYDSEYGMPNVMVFQPPVFGNSWSRYDDIIDYYDPQQQTEDGGCGVGYTLLDRAIYPFESFCDYRQNPPAILKGNDWHWYVTTKNSTDAKITSAALQHLGFDTESELHQYIHPLIPKELVALLKYCKVFTKDEYIYQLRPIIYWYWS